MGDTQGKLEPSSDPSPSAAAGAASSSMEMMDESSSQSPLLTHHQQETSCSSHQIIFVDGNPITTTVTPSSPECCVQPSNEPMNCRSGSSGTVFVSLNEMMQDASTSAMNGTPADAATDGVTDGAVSPAAAAAPDTPSVRVEEEDNVRLCWVCFATDEEVSPLTAGSRSNSMTSGAGGGDVPDEWVKPCKCKGSAKWVHQACLQRWIDEKQKSNTSTNVSCAQCKTEYILVFPKTNSIVYIIELYDRFLYSTSPFAAATIVIGSIYWSAVSFGALTVLQSFGHEEGKAVMEAADPLTLLVGLPSIPFMLIIGKLFRWEDQILTLWKNHYSQIPLLGWIVGEPAQPSRDSAEKILLGRDTYSDSTSSTRLFCGALLLPTVSSILGRFLFPSYDSQIKRTLLGGITFIVAKGFVRIILRQQQYIRQSKRIVDNYNDSPNLDTKHFSLPEGEEY